MVDDILEIENGIEDFSYPKFFVEIIKMNFLDYGDWYLMNKNQILIRKEGLNDRYPNRKLIPFARRDDNDDIACFDLDCVEKVFIIHDFSSEGYESRGEFDNFKSWLICTIGEYLKIEVNED